MTAGVAGAQTEPTTVPTSAPAPNPSTNPAPDHYTRRLETECDRLIELAEKRPYGWAWTESTEQFDGGAGGGGANARPGAPRENRRNVTVVAMGKRQTPGAGLILLMSGQFLNEQKYLDAAHEAARGAAATLTKNGQVLRAPTFGLTVGGRDAPAYVPPREATVAAMGLMLADLDVSGEHPDSIVRRSAVRAATWLSRQQAPNGGWPVGYPADAEGKDAARLQRLDSPDFRDCTWTLLLTGEVTSVQVYNRASRKACDLLLKMRLSRPPTSTDLWSIAYTVEGNLTEPYLAFPDGADMVSSRYALQTLLGASYFVDDADYAAA